MGPKPASAGEYIRRFPPPIRDLAASLWRIVRSAGPRLVEEIKWRMPVYSRPPGSAAGGPMARMACCLWGAKGHATLAFYRGADLPDPAGLLEGEGKGMRHVKLRPGDEIPAREVAALVKAAARRER